MLSRRSLLSAALTLPLVACKGTAASADAPPGRCAHCGMKLDPSSAWLSERVLPDGKKLSYDTPRCALLARAKDRAAGTLRVQDFYDRKWYDASELRFVTGSDVLGPMGPDLVPVDPARSAKFVQDHKGERALRLDEISQTTLDDLK